MGKLLITLTNEFHNWSEAQKLFKRYGLRKFTQEEIDSLNYPVSVKKQKL